ncbi:hypothetical protein CQA53_10720 [Helicobacter didelphidarum]|uniref:Uncharacterized protein n=1 Tax=Helicobacter didelphidarum TaxID=2040648 RepID=A0A3D8I7Y7_9HELI|nr:hypothetical protein [Helicobacter didelphidarum]RDU60641.1 hypothetical protein CQA53_10720 [Helicobacter didelphidarum]
MTLTKILYIFILSLVLNSFPNLSYASGLNDLMVRGVKPSFDCAKAKSDDEKIICGDGIGMAFNGVPIIDNFYTSYYNLVIKEINPSDKQTTKNISLQMLKQRRQCPSKLHFHDSFSKEAFDRENEKIAKEGYNPIDLENLSSGYASVLAMNCYESVYLKALREITEFIYTHPKYKHIFEQIFYPNPSKYYHLITIKKQNIPYELRDFDAEMVGEIIDEAIKDNLVESNGALK